MTLSALDILSFAEITRPSKMGRKSENTVSTPRAQVQILVFAGLPITLMWDKEYKQLTQERNKL